MKKSELVMFTFHVSGRTEFQFERGSVHIFTEGGDATIAPLEGQSGFTKHLIRDLSEWADRVDRGDLGELIG